MLGPSGSGKSTLLNILGGLDTATAGSVLFRGRDLTRFSDRELTLYRREPRRLRLPVLQSDPEPDGARERRAGHRDRAEPDEAGGGAGAGRAEGAHLDTFRRSFPAASSSAWPSPAPSPSGPRSCSATSRPARSIRKTGILVLEALIADQPRARHDHRDHHPQRRDRRASADRVFYFPRRPDQPGRDQRTPSEALAKSAGEASMRALDRKLFRDLCRLWAQSLAIALVMACGVATLILAIGAYRSLDETRAAYYERYRFGDVFASATRAPNCLGATIAAIDGVAAVETRIAETVLLDIEGMREPATGRLISLRSRAASRRQRAVPAPGAPARSRAGATRSWSTSNFAEAHGFGARFDAFGHHQRRQDRAHHRRHRAVAGIRLRARPRRHDAGQPALRRASGCPRTALALALRSRRRLQLVSLRLLPGASEAKVIEALDASARALRRHRRLRPQGPAVATPSSTASSTSSGPWREIIPPIFLAVSAFLINMILSRLISLEREQIGLLKALGYGRTRGGLALPQAGAGDRRGRHR